MWFVVSLVLAKWMSYLRCQDGADGVMGEMLAMRSRRNLFRKGAKHVMGDNAKYDANPNSPLAMF